jgi:hypothetical protein
VAAAVSTSAGFDAGVFGRDQSGLRVLDEAVRLLDLLQARQPRRAPASDPDADADSTARHRGDQCRLCPVCRGLAALREANPEAVARMTSAVAELAAAIGDLVAGPDRDRPGRDRPDPAPPDRVQRDPAAETVPPWYATPQREAASAAAPPTVQRIDVTE